MTDPSFLIGGTVAAGTSFLSSCLEQHPEIYLPREMRPEPNFFAKQCEFERGLDYYRRKYFAAWNGQKAAGERSSLVFSCAKAPERIARSFPDIRLIFILRHPVDRTWANYRFTVLSGLEYRSFERALELEETRLAATRDTFWRDVRPYAYRERSVYAPQLAKFLEHCDPKRILLVKSESLRKDPSGELARICRFIGVDPLASWSWPETFTSPEVRSPLLQRAFRLLYGSSFDPAVERIRSREALHPIDWPLRFNFTSRRDGLDSVTRRLLLDSFKPSLDALSPMLPWSIEDWRI